MRDLILDASVRKANRYLQEKSSPKDRSRKGRRFLTNQEPLAPTLVKAGKLQRAGHIERMHGRLIPKRGRSYVRWPKGKRWEDSADADGWSILRFSNWRARALDQNTWRRCIWKAKDRFGLQRLRSRSFSYSNRRLFCSHLKIALYYHFYHFIFCLNSLKTWAQEKSNAFKGIRSHKLAHYILQRS